MADVARAHAVADQILQIARERGGALAADCQHQVLLLAHGAGVEVSSQLFELTGARSTSARWGLDRFWRNARVHTLHDPVDYKLRDIGAWALRDELPTPSFYA